MSERIDSKSVGDTQRFLTLPALEAALLALAPPPTADGEVVQILRRGDAGVREVLAQTPIDAELGVPGDRWARGATPDPEAQITVMRADVARLIANGQSLTLFGDNLLVDQDLSAENLPPGSRLQLGSAVVEVTPKPHNGCSKFKARFGADALRLVSKPSWRHLNLRGIHVRVLTPGDLRLGERVVVLYRASSAG